MVEKRPRGAVFSLFCKISPPITIIFRCTRLGKLTALRLGGVFVGKKYLFFDLFSGGVKNRRFFMFFYVFFLGFGVGFFYFELWVVYHVFSYFFGFLGF